MLLSLLTAVASSPACAQLEGFEKQFKGAASAPSGASGIQGGREMSEGEAQLALGIVNILIRIPAIPFAMAYNMPHSGYAPFPYAYGIEKPLIFGKGPQTPSQLLSLSYQSVSEGTAGFGVRYRLMSENHIGMELGWVRYKEKGVATPLSVYDLSVTGNFHQEEAMVNAFGLGLRALAGATTRLGPELRLKSEVFPRKPFAGDGSVGLSLINGKGLWDIRLGAGVMLRQVELRLGYRWLAGPALTLDGPEAGVNVWF